MIGKLLLPTITSAIDAISGDKEDKTAKYLASSLEEKDKVQDKLEEVDDALDESYDKSKSTISKSKLKKLEEDAKNQAKVDELNEAVTESEETVDPLMSSILSKLDMIMYELEVQKSKPSAVKEESSTDKTEFNMEKYELPKRPHIWDKYYTAEGKIAHGKNRIRAYRAAVEDRNKKSKHNNLVDLIEQQRRIENRRWFATIGLLGNITNWQYYQNQKAQIKQQYEGEARNRELKSLKEARKEERKSNLKKLGMWTALGITPFLLSKTLRSLVNTFAETNPIGKRLKGIFDFITGKISNAWEWFTTNTTIGKKIEEYRSKLYEKLNFDSDKSLWKNLTDKISEVTKTKIAPGIANFLSGSNLISPDQASDIKSSDDFLLVLVKSISSMLEHVVARLFGYEDLANYLGYGKSANIFDNLKAPIAYLLLKMLGVTNVDEAKALNLLEGDAANNFKILFGAFSDNYLKPIIQPIYDEIKDLIRKVDLLGLFEKGNKYAEKYTKEELELIAQGKGVKGLSRPSLEDTYWAQEILEHPEKYMPKSDIVKESVSSKVNVTGVESDSIKNRLKRAILDQIQYNYNPKLAGEVKQAMFGGNGGPIPIAELGSFLDSIKDPILLAIAGLRLVNDYNSMPQLKKLYEDALSGIDFGSTEANNARDSILKSLEIFPDSRRRVIRAGILGAGGVDFNFAKNWGGKSELDLANDIQKYLDLVHANQPIYRSDYISSRQAPLESVTGIPQVSNPLDIDKLETPKYEFTNEPTNLDLSELIQSFKTELPETLKEVIKPSLSILPTKESVITVPQIQVIKDPDFSINEHAYGST